MSGRALLGVAAALLLTVTSACQLESTTSATEHDAGGSGGSSGAGGSGGGSAGAGDAPQEPEFLEVTTLQRDSAVIVEKVSYMSDGLRVFGIVCRPVDAVSRPVLVVNHGGFEGIAAGELQDSGMCVSAARNGYVVIEAGYRGEPLFTGEPRDLSEGRVEVCLGEVDDVQNLMRIVRREPYADAARFAAFGGSHGGCITQQLALREPSLRAAVDFAGPTDFIAQAAWWQAQLDQGESSCADSAATCEATHQALLMLLQQATGGTPASEPDAYQARSPRGRLDTLSVPMLFVHGSDDYVVNVDQTCLKRTALLAAGIAPSAWYLLDDLSPADPSAVCQGGFSSAPAPDPKAPDSWRGKRAMVLVYHGQGHSFAAGAPATTHAAALAMSFLAVHLAD